MDVFSMIKHSLLAESSNPVLQHYQLGRQIGTAGPEMVWKIYEAQRLGDQREVSVFLFEKKIADKLHKPKRREIVTEILRKEIKQLTRLKHPKILKVLHAIEECHDSLAFVTEPVLGSLANLLGNYDRMPANVPQEIKDYVFLDVEIKYGILQIVEALNFLHSSERILHGNINPASIIITKRGMWRLAGLGFCEKPREGNHKHESFKFSQWTPKHPKMAQPDLDFMAPEIQLDPGGKVCSCSFDMFSLGMVLCAIFNGGHSLLLAAHNVANYSKQLDKLTESFGEVAHRMPLQLVEPVEKMINKDIRYRPSAQSFMMLKFFDDPVVRCMQALDSVDSKDLPQKCEFFTKLAQVIPQFPRKVLYGSVFPVITEQIDHQDMLVLVLPTFVAIVEHSSEEDYKTIIQPEFKTVFNMTRPVQATVFLLEKLPVIMSRASEEDIKVDVLPMIFTMLESNSIQGQEAAISVFSTIKKYLDDQTMRKLVLPKAKALFNKSTNVRTRLNALACIDRLLDSLGKMMILDEVLPFLTEIQVQDVDIIMSVIAIYKHLLSDKKFGLTHSLLATKVMPTLIPHTVLPGLNIEQFQTVVEVLREMLDQIDRQRMAKMLSETPDHQALELRSSMQQMYSYYQSSGPPPLQHRGSHPVIRLPDDYAYHRMGKRPSWGSSNSSLTSNYSFGGRCSPRRPSLDMRYQAIDSTPGKIDTGGNRYRLSVEEAYNSRYRPPSTPELQTRGSQDSLTPLNYRRHSSVQGLGKEEQAVLERIVRRSSLAPGSHGSIGNSSETPRIQVSGASITDIAEQFFYNPRRSSTQSMGPVGVPVSANNVPYDHGRRDSRGRVLDLPQTGPRRSSFQGFCDRVQLFVGK